MKTLRLISILFALFLFTSAYAVNPIDESAVKQVIINYFSGIDGRNSDAVKEALYPEATVLTVNAIINKTLLFSPDDIISQLKKGTLGGWVREVNISSFEANDNTAMAKIEISAPKMKQTSYISLVNDNGSWKIVSDVSLITRNE